jgi:aldose 1-epimerase
MTKTIDRRSFGRLPDGRDTVLYTLDNDILRVQITDFGGRLVSVEAPARDGARAHVLLGLDHAPAYKEKGGSFGAILGRCANRIADGRFTLNGETIQLATNKSGVAMHGGPLNFGKAIWRTESVTAANAPELILSHESPDGDQGYPGALKAKATYRLDGDTLWLILEACAEAATIVNLSSHPYFNLAGVEDHDIYEHEVTFHASAFLPVDDRQIPTGEIRSVDGTVFDFRRPRKIGMSIRADDPQLLIGRGYDHCFALDGGSTSEPRLVATVSDAGSKRTLDILTTQPGLQLYSGNSLDGSLVGRGGVVYRQSSGLALEAQGFPDAPNHPSFPSIVLKPGQPYREVIGYRFR